MDRIAKGMKVWGDVQARMLPKLKDLTVGAAPPNRAVLFVEPRRHPAFEFCIRNIRASLDWKIIIVHGSNNKDYVESICKSIPGEFEFIDCGLANLPNKEYNTLFMSLKFWEPFPEWILIAQTDTMILKGKEEATAHLEDLISKDIKYIGAPWSYTCNACLEPLVKGCGHMIDQAVISKLKNGGNGGLSLRHVPSMRAALEQYTLDIQLGEASKSWKVDVKEKLKGTTNEDVFFCKAFDLLNFKVADRMTSLEFAIEQVAPFDLGTKSFGVHKPWVYLDDKLVRYLLE
jgi:hypothetical protein